MSSSRWGEGFASFLLLGCLAALGCGSSLGNASDAPDGVGGGPSNCTGAGCTSAGGAFGTGGAGAGDGGSASGGALPIVCPPSGTGAGEDGAVEAAEAGGVLVELHINHLGYELGGAKRAVVEASGALTRFQVVRATDDRVFFSGSLGGAIAFSAWSGAAQHYVADFSELRDAGTYELVVNGVRSEPFTVGEGLLLSQTAGDVLEYFRLSRADDGPVQTADQSVPLFGGGGSADVRGGWYDASGDLSKYLSHLSYANFLNPQQIPLTAWVLAEVSESEAIDALGLADEARAEAAYGADYLVRVLDDAGFFYLNVFDGWTGIPDDRDVCAFEGSEGTKTAEYQAAFREGGGMAIAALARASTLDESGAFTSGQYLEAAEAGFTHLSSANAGYTDNGQENVIDDYAALLAATELFAATANASYATAARTRAASLVGRLHADGYFVANGASRPFWHASDAGLPIIALVRYAEVETLPESRQAALDAIRTHLDYWVEVTREVQNPFGYARQHFTHGGSVRSGFFIPHDNETGYWWQGESARLASLAAASVLGARAVGAAGCGLGVRDDLAVFAADQMDWILGKNPFDVSMMAGHGRNNPPTYCSSKNEFHGHHDGGISNGITGASADGSGIQWMVQGLPAEECWQQWRWVEQWLPHSTWFLLAATAFAEPG